MPRLSIVAPVYNEEESLPAFLAELRKSLLGYDYEIILVDDGSSDGSAAVMRRQPDIKYIQFSRNFGHQAALRAGLDHARGDAVVTLDSDLQHPPNLIPELVRRWEEGYQIVYTRRRDGATVPLKKRLTSGIYYWILRNLSGLDVDYGSADFRLLDRRVVTVIRDGEPDLFLRGFIAWAGYRTAAIDYVPEERFAGRSKYSMRMMWALALQGITQYSIKPLRLASWLGFLVAAFGCFYALYALWERFFGTQIITGWASILIAVLVLGGVQLVVLGIIGEYLGRTFIQTKNRPQYLIGDTNIRSDQTPNPVKGHPRPE